MTITGTVKHPVQAAIVFTVRNATGATGGNAVIDVRLDKNGSVSQHVLAAAQMSPTDFAHGYDRCTTQLAWTPLAGQ